MNEMSRIFSQHEATVLGRRAAELGESADALSRFALESPELAQLAGVEISALEARSILHSGAIHRVAAQTLGNARGGRQAQISAGDLEAMTRLEAVISLASSRLGASVNMLDQQHARGGMETLGSVIGLATGAIGLWKALT